MPKLNIAFCLFLIIVDIVCKLYPEMNATKKVKLIESGRLFREEWTKLFGAIERNGKALCTLCGDSVVLSYFKHQTAFRNQPQKYC